MFENNRSDAEGFYKEYRVDSPDSSSIRHTVGLAIALNLFDSIIARNESFSSRSCLFTSLFKQILILFSSIVEFPTQVVEH